MSEIKFTTQDLLHKQFKEKLKGYDQTEVDHYLDDIIKDYDTFHDELTQLKDENERLRAKVDELNRQVEVGSTMNQSANEGAQPISSATNMDILKRLSNLERRVFGSQMGSGESDDSDSHLL